jgi:hypothetical protein
MLAGHPCADAFKPRLLIGDDKEHCSRPSATTTTTTVNEMTTPPREPSSTSWAPAQVRDRLRAMLLHLALSITVAALVAALVFALWYPSPYREISGGRDLFLLLVAVDVVTGPVLTFVIFDRRKPRAELMRDLGVIVLLQLAALAYGLYSVERARPAVVALEVDRLRVVRSADLDRADFSQAPDGLRSLSLWGPTLVATRAPTDAERQDVITRGLAGEDIGMRPKFWRPPAETAPAYALAARPVAQLKLLRPSRSAALKRAVEATGHTEDQVGFLPMLARRTDWSALIDLKSGAVVGYVDIEGF